MGYIQPKVDYKDGDVLHGIDLNASNEVIKAGVDDNFDRIQGLETEKQDVIDSSNKLDYSLLDNTPEIPTKVSDLTNDTGFITADYHDSTKQNVLTAGEGISIDGNVISNTQTSAEWGNIQGNIEDQTDLMSAFADKQDKIDSANKLDYSLLDNTPTIPSKTSDLTNDSGFIDSTYHDITKQDTLVSGTNIKTINNQNILGSGNISIGGGSGGTSDYDQLENRPQINNVTLSGNKSLSDLGINIPTKLSDLTNDNNTVTDTDYVHTDSNYTAAEKTKLSSIENGAEVNEIDTIKVNNVAQTVSSKEVNITVPTNLSDLTNDNNTVTDANYVHTDNNYTSAEKTKLAGIEAGAQVNVDEILIGDESAATADTKLIIEESDLDFQGLDLDYVFPIGKVELFFDALDHSDYLGLQWEQVGAGRVPVGLDTNDTNFDTIGKTGGSKYLQEHKHIDVQLAGNHLTSWNSRTGSTGIFEISSLSQSNGTANQNYFLTGNVHEAQTGNSGNLQPYIVMAFWRRIA